MDPEPTKETLSNAEYFQLIGLLHLAKIQYDKLRDIEEAVATIFGMEIVDDGYYGHVSDAIWCGNDGWRSANDLMRKMDIELE